MGEKKKEMPTTVWFSLKKSLHCQSEPSDVHNPTTKKQLGAILTRKSGGGGSRSSDADVLVAGGGGGVQSGSSM